MSATCICSVRQLSVLKISFFEPHSRDIAHPGSGSAQSLLRFCLGWLTFAHPKFYDVYWLESDLPLPSGWPTARWWTKNCADFALKNIQRFLGSNIGALNAGVTLRLRCSGAMSEELFVRIVRSVLSLRLATLCRLYICERDSATLPRCGAVLRQVYQYMWRGSNNGMFCSRGCPHEL